MDDKEIRFAEVAVEVFSRYGFRRATMGDIAESAGVSRQTLYATYASKEEVLVGAIRLAHQKTIAAIKADWATLATISEKLDSYFEHAVIDYFEKIRAMPDADDLISGVNEAGTAVLNSAVEEKRLMIANAFAGFSVPLAKNGTNPDDLADFVIKASWNFKLVATDLPHLKRLLGTLKQSVLVMLGENSTP